MTDSESTQPIKAHSPQDEIYGPLSIPDYCWPIIDTVEFQRLRHILQLGCCHFVYPGATHTRFEHCLGVAHLANIFMTHLKNVQPELDIQKEYCQAVVIAGLAHDLGHGPWSHCFEKFVHTFEDYRDWDHEEMSCAMLEYINTKYHLEEYGISYDVIDAACHYIKGFVYDKFPPWLSQIIANKTTDIDLDKFDYLARDINRTLCIGDFQNDRLLYHCRVVDNQLAWRQSEVTTIECLFHTRNDMHNRVYQHRVVQSIALMISDMLLAAEEYLNIHDALRDVELYNNIDDRLFSFILAGDCGPCAQNIAKAIIERKLYKCIGELRMDPNNTRGMQYSQQTDINYENDIAEYGEGKLTGELIRVQKMYFRLGLSEDDTTHPLLKIPLYKTEHTANGINYIPYSLNEDDISCIVPVHFMETAFRIFVTDPEVIEEGKRAFQIWKEKRCYQ